MDSSKDIGLIQWNNQCTKVPQKGIYKERAAKQGFLWFPQSLKPDRKTFLDKLVPVRQRFLSCPVVYGRGNPTGIRLTLIFFCQRESREGPLDGFGECIDGLEMK